MGKSKAPDMSGQNEAALRASELSKEQFEWAKGEYERTAPERAEATRRANEMSDLQADAARTNNAIAADYYDYSKETFRPVEKQLVEDATNYDTPERRAEAAQAAGAGVEQQISAQRDAGMRALARSGVDPSSGKTAALMSLQDVAGAKAKAGAANAAEQNVETQGYARRMDAASLGRGLASNQATSSQIATQQGSAAAATGMIPLQASASGQQVMNQGFSGALAGTQIAGNIYGDIARNQISANNSGSGNAAIGALGSIAGGFIARSDENVKEDIDPVSDTAAITAIRKMPVKEWQYKEETGLSDARHVGPMAQDVQAAAGDVAAPDGKAIDLVTMNGMAIAALQNVDRRLAKMEGKSK